MYDWNAPAHLPEYEAGDVDDTTSAARELVSAVDSELEAAIEYKLSVSGYAGVAEIVEILNRSVRRRWVRGERN